MASQTRPLPSLGGRDPIGRLIGLYDIVRSLNSIIHLDKLLEQIATSAVEMIEAKAGAILLVDPSGTHLTFEVATGQASKSLKGVAVPMSERSIIGLVVKTGKPYIENDAQRSPNFSGIVDKQTGYKTGKLVCVPLKVQERITGAVEVLDKISGRNFDEDDVKLLEALADVAAVAIENVRLYEEAQQRAQELAQAYEGLQKTYQGTLQALTGLLDARDTATHGHSNRVVAFTLRLARAMGITDQKRLRVLEQGALLHDVGKIGVPDAILRKPGPLTDEEWTQMRAHPEIGYRMLKDIEFLKEALVVVRYHHEHWDGSGYPAHLSEENIPIEARVFAVVDAFDAITSERPYSKARTYEQAAAIIHKASGQIFGPSIVRAFLSVPKEDWSRIREDLARHRSRPQEFDRSPHKTLPL